MFHIPAHKNVANPAGQRQVGGSPRNPQAQHRIASLQRQAELSDLRGDFDIAFNLRADADEMADQFGKRPSFDAADQH